MSRANLVKWGVAWCGKARLLELINAELGTAYQEPHLNNWLADRKPVPRTVWDMLASLFLKQILPVRLASPVLSTLGLWRSSQAHQ